MSTPQRATRIASTAPLLTVRALNRATLSRQLLLERATLPVAETVEHLVGMQAQTTRSWYVGLWSRLEGFRAQEASDLLEARALVRMSLLRGTIHLATARDAWGLRPLMQPAFERILSGNFSRGLRGVDLEDLAAAGAEILAKTPMTPAELGRALAGRWPDNDPTALAVAVNVVVPLVQVTPRGLWGRSGRPAHATLESWLGEPQPAFALGDVLVRYLRAFGPASVADMQAWSGLAGLGGTVEALRPQLAIFRDENGIELFDLPDAPRPDPATPAPPRYIYDYDNLFLSHADRTRVISAEDRRRAIDRIGAISYGGILVDGFHAGLWRIRQEGRGKRNAVLEVELARQLPPRERSELAEEGTRLLEFMAHDAQQQDIEFGLLVPE